MSLNHGRTQLAIPGPSVIPERVLAAMHRPSPNIYHGELIEITESLYPDLQNVARTQNSVAIYISNGHGVWEAALRNVIDPGDKILVLATGTFGLGWGEVAESLGIEVEYLDFGFQNDADPQKVEDVLKNDRDGKIKALLTVQTDTATSVINDIPALRKAIDNSGHDCLYMVDCIASLGCDRFEMDDWNVDVMVAACQKGLMVPAGISFVYFNEKAAKAAEKTMPGQYWDWLPRTQPEVYYQKFAGTAPTQHIFGLREALNILVHEEGIEAAWARHQTISSAIWGAIDRWGENGMMHHNITNPVKRSRAVSAITTCKNHAGLIRDWCEHNAGITLGIGLGLAKPGTPQWEQHFRIGHMGHQNVAMTMAVLGAIDTALKAQNITHGDGALELATAILADHAK